jgi:hypothetical protein
VTCDGVLARGAFNWVDGELRLIMEDVGAWLVPAGDDPVTVIPAHRAALESRGVETDGWFDPQLALCLIGYTLLMGWEKALAGGDELAWWQDRALAARPYLVSV